MVVPMVMVPVTAVGVGPPVIGITYAVIAGVRAIIAPIWRITCVGAVITAVPIRTGVAIAVGRSIAEAHDYVAATAVMRRCGGRSEGGCAGRNRKKEESVHVASPSSSDEPSNR